MNVRRATKARQRAGLRAWTARQTRAQGTVHTERALTGHRLTSEPGVLPSSLAPHTTSLGARQRAWLRTPAAQSAPPPLPQAHTPLLAGVALRRKPLLQAAGVPAVHHLGGAALLLALEGDPGVVGDMGGISAGEGLARGLARARR